MNSRALKQRCCFTLMLVQCSTLENIVTPVQNFNLLMLMILALGNILHV